MEEPHRILEATSAISEKEDVARDKRPCIAVPEVRTPASHVIEPLPPTEDHTPTPSVLQMSLILEALNDMIKERKQLNETLNNINKNYDQIKEVKQASGRDTCMEDQPTENVKAEVTPHPAERREGPADITRQAEDDIHQVEGQPVPPRAGHQESKDVARRVEEQPGPPTAHITVHPPKTAPATYKPNTHEDNPQNNRSKTETHNKSKSKQKPKNYESKPQTRRITIRPKRKPTSRVHLHRRHIRLKSYIKSFTSMHDRRKTISRRTYNHRSHVRLKSSRLYTGMQKRKISFGKTHRHHRHVRFKDIKLHVTGQQRGNEFVRIDLHHRHIRFKPSLIKRIVANWNGKLKQIPKSNLDGGL